MIYDYLIELANIVNIFNIARIIAQQHAIIKLLKYYSRLIELTTN